MVLMPHKDPTRTIDTTELIASCWFIHRDLEVSRSVLTASRRCESLCGEVASFHFVVGNLWNLNHENGRAYPLITHAVVTRCLVGLADAFDFVRPVSTLLLFLWLSANQPIKSRETVCVHSPKEQHRKMEPIAPSGCKKPELSPSNLQVASLLAQFCTASLLLVGTCRSE